MKIQPSDAARCVFCAAGRHRVCTGFKDHHTECVCLVCMGHAAPSTGRKL